MVKKSTSNYKELLETSVRSNEQTIQALREHTDVMKEIKDNLVTINSNTMKINDNFHDDMEIVKNHLIKNNEELKTWLKYSIIALIIAIGGASILKVIGLI